MPLSDQQYNDLAKIKEKSEDDYEKNIVFITAGTLVLSLTFIEKIVNLKESSAVWILIISWALLAVTLLLNLVSHQLSSYYHDKCMALYAKDCEDAETETDRCNKITRNINWSTTATLTIGIFLLVLFCSINAFNMANETKDIKPSSSDLQKGRTITAPLKPSQAGNSPSISSDTNSKPKPSSDGKK